MLIKNLCVFVLGMKVASLEGLSIKWFKWQLSRRDISKHELGLRVKSAQDVGVINGALGCPSQRSLSTRNCLEGRRLHNVLLVNRYSMHSGLKSGNTLLNPLSSPARAILLPSDAWKCICAIFSHLRLIRQFSLLNPLGISIKGSILDLMK